MLAPWEGTAPHCRLRERSGSRRARWIHVPAPALGRVRAPRHRLIGVGQAGDGHSTGDWHAQPNDDRAREALAAIAFLHGRPDIAPTKIGMCGISQAGWVLPVMCALSDAIAFLIAVSTPVGTGAEQELFRVAHGLPANGYSADDTAQALAFTRLRLDLLRADAPYATIAEAQRRVAMERWFEPLGWLDEDVCAFLKAGVFVSPRPFLPAIACPVLAIFGERDTIVDANESARVYAKDLRRGQLRCHRRDIPRRRPRHLP